MILWHLSLNSLWDRRLTNSGGLLTCCSRVEVLPLTPSTEDTPMATVMKAYKQVEPGCLRLAASMDAKNYTQQHLFLIDFTFLIALRFELSPKSWMETFLWRHDLCPLFTRMTFFHRTAHTNNCQLAVIKTELNLSCMSQKNSEIVSASLSLARTLPPVFIIWDKTFNTHGNGTKDKEMKERLKGNTQKRGAAQ